MHFVLLTSQKSTIPQTVHLISCNWLPFYRPCSFASQTFIWFAGFLIIAFKHMRKRLVLLYSNTLLYTRKILRFTSSQLLSPADIQTNTQIRYFMIDSNKFIISRKYRNTIFFRVFMGLLVHTYKFLQFFLLFDNYSFKKSVFQV